MIVKADTFDLALPLSHSERLSRPGPSTGSSALVVAARQRSENRERIWDVLVPDQSDAYLERLLSLYEAGGYGSRPLGFTPADGGSEVLVLMEETDGLETTRTGQTSHAMRFQLREVF